MNETFKKFAV